jgi:uncharacterized protein YjbJ (UPF0337 family)
MASWRWESQRFNLCATCADELGTFSNGVCCWASQKIGDTAMNWDQIEGNWKQFKGKAKVKWGELTDDELDQVEGNRERLEGKIQEKYGVAREEAKRQVDEWFDSVDRN